MSAHSSKIGHEAQKLSRTTLVCQDSSVSTTFSAYTSNASFDTKMVPSHRLWPREMVSNPSPHVSAANSLV